ncbi:MAG: hypothetical protein ABGX00_14685 [Allomuricauda sp.]
MKTTKKLNNDRLISVAIGLVYLWFGALKFVPHLSPAEDLARNTIDHLTFGLINERLSIILLAIWEVGLGLLLIFNLFKRTAIYIALAHMVLTFTPLIFFPNETFGQGPFVLTLVGQYIIKNLIIIAALLSLRPSPKESRVPKTVMATEEKAVPKFQLIGKDFFKKVRHS